MKHLILFEKFTESKKNTVIIYEDDDLVVKLVRTLDSSKKISDPQWCSTSPHGFYYHNLTANMFRFIFSDGYKLRLTWDYLPWDGNSYSGGTHWGQGGTINGEPAFYHNIRPKNEDKPFEFDYHKDDYRQYMVDRITQIPKSAIEAVTKYHKDNERYKTSLYNKLYKEVEKIKVIDVKDDEKERVNLKYDLYYNITLLYNNKRYTIPCSYYRPVNSPQDLRFRFYGTTFIKEFKNKYAFSEEKTISNYLKDKTVEWMKLHDKEEYNKFKSVYNQKVDIEENEEDYF